MKSKNSQTIVAQKDSSSKEQTKIEDKTPLRPKSMVGKETESEEVFALGKTNIKLIGLSFLVIIIGFLLMIGSGSTPETYNPDIFSFRRLILGPGIAFIGFVFMVYAIMYKSKKNKKEEA